jgi:hypothetical protein
MASISGSQTNAGVKVATTWGTAVAAGTGNRWVGEINPSFNTSELIARSIGSGAYMTANRTRGAYKPTASITGDLGYRNNCDVIIAQFMGTSGAPVEATGAQGDYVHTITFNSTLNAKYLTFAYETSSTTTQELSTCSTSRIGIKTTSVPGYLEFSADLLAYDIALSSSTNTNATLAATTFTEGTPELVACDYSDAFRTNAQSAGSIATGNLYSITSMAFDMSRPQETIPEIKGSSGLSAPVGTEKADGSLEIQVKELADHAYYTIWSAETAQKASIDIQGTTIASGTNKTFKILMPRLLLVEAPTYAVTSEGTNGLTLKFGFAKASANPTGMTSTYPYFLITNTLATSLLA